MFYIFWVRTKNKSQRYFPYLKEIFIPFIKVFKNKLQGISSRHYVWTIEHWQFIK